MDRPRSGLGRMRNLWSGSGGTCDDEGESAPADDNSPTELARGNARLAGLDSLPASRAR